MQTQNFLLYYTDRTENDSDRSSDSCVFAASGTCLPGRHLATIGFIHRRTEGKIISPAYSYFLPYFSDLKKMIREL
jgi:hypothetical protein